MSGALPAEKVVPYLARNVCLLFQMAQTRRAKEFISCCIHCFHPARVKLMPKSAGSETRLRGRVRQSVPHGDNKDIIVSLVCHVKKVLKRDDITRLKSCVLYLKVLSIKIPQNHFFVTS